jgi:hypothetical protein
LDIVPSAEHFSVGIHATKFLKVFHTPPIVVGGQESLMTNNCVLASLPALVFKNVFKLKDRPQEATLLFIFYHFLNFIDPQGRPML